MSQLQKPLIKTKKQLLLMDAILLAGVLVAPLLSRWMLNAWPDCVFQQFGITCPTCGGTRCVFAFFHLRFAQAFAFHPVFFFILVYVLVAVVLLHLNVLLDHPTLNTITRATVHTRAVIAWAIILTAFGVVRMILSVL